MFAFAQGDGGSWSVGDVADQAPPSSIKKKFTEEEDQYLLYLVSIHGIRDWKTVSWHMRGRTVRQCRERFKYYLEHRMRIASCSRSTTQLGRSRRFSRYFSTAEPTSISKISITASAGQ
jgi:hypothetical protein